MTDLNLRCRFCDTLLEEEEETTTCSQCEAEFETLRRRVGLGCMFLVVTASVLWALFR